MDLTAARQRASALATTGYRIFSCRHRAIAPTVVALATPTDAFAHPTALERLAALQATARLGDESRLWGRFLVLFHLKRLPRFGTT